MAGLWLCVIGAACSAKNPSVPTPGDDDHRTTPRQGMQAGGQTGMEGTCIRRAVDANDYSGADVRKLIEGKHETTVAERTKDQAIEDEPANPTTRRMRVDVVAKGDARIDDHSECGAGVLEQDIEMRFEEPALDTIIETTVRAFAADFAVLQVDLDQVVADALGSPYGLSMAFDARGVHGTLGWSGCDVAVFPAGAHCPEWEQVEIDLASKAVGFEPSDLFDAVDALTEIPVKWDDGSSTTLSVALAKRPAWACSYDAIETVCPEHLTASATLHVTTGDKRVDLELPAEISFEVATAASVKYHCGDAPNAGWDGSISLDSSVILLRSALTNGKATLDVPLPDDGDIQVVVGIGRSRDDGVTLAEIQVGAASLPSDAPAIAQPLDLNAMGKPCVSQAKPIARVGMMKPGF